jgi:GATA-binding protein
MCLVLGQHLAADFRPDHHTHEMSEGLPQSPPRRREEFHTLPALSSRGPSKEDIELAQHLIVHSQGTRNILQNQGEQNARISQSPALNAQASEPSSPSAERMRQEVSRSTSLEKTIQEEEQSYMTGGSTQPDDIPSGQVCR